MVTFTINKNPIHVSIYPIHTDPSWVSVDHKDGDRDGFTMIRTVFPVGNQSIHDLESIGNILFRFQHHVGIPICIPVLIRECDFFITESLH